jgi:hypothetical protein
MRISQSNFTLSRRQVSEAYRNNRTSSRSRLVLRTLKDVFPSKAPMAPPEIPHLVQCLEVKRSRVLILQRKYLDANCLGFVVDVLEELTMVTRPVLSKIPENGRERSVWHGNLK